MAARHYHGSSVCTASWDTAQPVDDSSLDLDDHAADVMSSAEDLVSMDPSLRETEYYKDLGFLSVAESAAAQQMASRVTASFRLSDEANVSFADGAVIITCSTPLCCPLGFAEESCNIPHHGSSNLRLPQDGFISHDGLGGLEKDKALDDDDRKAFPDLVRSMSTSRRYSWESPISPSDNSRRLSLDALEIEDLDYDSMASMSPSQSLNLPAGGLVAWTQGTMAGSGDSNAGTRDLALCECGTDREDKDYDTGKRLRSKSVPATLDKICTQRLSHNLGSSCPVTEGAETSPLEKAEPDHVEPHHVLIVQQVLQELKEYHGAKQRNCSSEGSVESKQDLTWFEFLSNENVGSGKNDKVERGTKVKRRLSSLKSRVTGSWQKDKGKSKEQQKVKEKEKEPKERVKLVHGHHLVPGAFSSFTSCTLCGKLLVNKNGLQCLNCAVNVHKNCKTLLAECSGSTKPKQKDLHQRSPGPFQGSSHCSYQATSLKEQPRIPFLAPDGTPILPRSHSMTISHRGHSQTSLNTTTASKFGQFTGEMDETDASFLKMRITPDDAISLAPSTTESIFVEDSYFASLKNEIETDAQDFDAESWSCAVEQSFAKKQKKEVIKRQDVIYELMQTEMHHIRTLKIMVKVYSKAMRDEQFSGNVIKSLFPCVDDLLEMHGQFLYWLKERRKESLEEGSDRNYIIQKIGDVLVQQFSGENGDRMKEKYGVFCSHHNEAVNSYKELLQQSKKFQNLMKKIGNSSIVRRLAVHECILLVTQRLTKYPVLLERIIQNTEAGTEDFEHLTQALGLIKDILFSVDATVNQREKVQRLREIVFKMDLKSFGKLKNGLMFRKDDMLRRQLIHDGMLLWKAASGRLKDTLVVLLTDVLLLLQEKDQKYTFTYVDSKTPVISLQKLIVREVANEEKAMFLISASSVAAEMYEIYTSSKEERNLWMGLIRGAVEKCPDDEVSFPDERRVADERFAKLKEYQDRLSQKDDMIAQNLSDKLQIYSEMSELNGFEDSTQGTRALLLRGEASESLQGERILKCAVTEVENLQNLMFTHLGSSTNQTEESSGNPGSLKRAETFGGYDSLPSTGSRGGSFKKKVYGGEQRPRESRILSDTSESQIQDPFEGTEGDSCMNEPQCQNKKIHLSLEPELVQRIQTLTQLLFSLQAVISQQDSYIEVQRASSVDREKQYRVPNPRGNWLVEQEKQRNYEKQKEELANVHKLQNQLRQEQQRWERDRERQQREREKSEASLQQWEAQLQQDQQRLVEEQRALETHREEYQHDLERLREVQRAVEKEKEQLEFRRKKRATTLSGPFSPDLVQGLSHSASFNGEGLSGVEAAVQHMVKLPGMVSASMSAADYSERPEVVRRDSGPMENRLAPKNEVPIHLLSATNQIQKPASVQQQIPRKLAAFTKGGKDKGLKGKASHRTDSSASVDLKQLLPSRLSGKDDGTLRNRRSASPSLMNMPFQQDLSGIPEPHPEALLSPPSLHRPSSTHALSLRVPSPPAQSPGDEDTNKEDVIFF
ncbi:rho guanine nucleotide exchange factor 18 isoform X2 [Lissotriton helveticus]